MVAAAHLVHCWTCGDGRVGTSAAEFVSLSCDLDIATRDTRYGAGIANAVSGVSSNSRRGAPISAQAECAAMGCRAFSHVVVPRVPPGFRGGSKPRDRNLLRGPDL